MKTLPHTSHAHTQTHTHTHTRTHARTHIHTRTHARTHTRARAAKNIEKIREVYWFQKGKFKKIVSRRAVTDGERKREFKICAAEKLLLVKILFEEVRFKASFEGREGRAVTESERQRSADLGGREAELGTATVLF